MATTISAQQQALDLLFRAQTLLLSQLHTPKLVSTELAEGLDKLFQAYELVENPDAEVPTCPDCHSVFYGKVNACRYRCPVCGQELLRQ